MLKLYRCECTTRVLSERRARTRHQHPAPCRACPNWRNVMLQAEEIAVIVPLDEIAAYYRSDKASLFAPLLRVVTGG